MGQEYATEQYQSLVREVTRAQQAGELRADLDPAVAASLLVSLPATMFKNHDISVEALVDLLLQGMGV